MEHLHEHLPTPHDLRTTIYVSQDGDIVRADPKLFPNALCLLPNCDLNRATSQAQDGGDPSMDGYPAGPLSSGGDMTAAEASEYPIEADMSTRSYPRGSMVYNEWGELVDPEELRAGMAAQKTDKRSILRLLTLNWHYYHRRRLGEILNAQLEGDSPFDDGPLTLSGRLMSWELKTAPKQNPPAENPPQTNFKVPIFDGPPRILDIGCDEGQWCFALKKQHPDWIVEGLDDVNRWAGSRNGNDIKDFMDGQGPPSKYFGNIHVTQKGPEFTLRCYDNLLEHPKPIPRYLYGLVHARDVLAKVSNYKSFLDDVLQIVQPDGVVEFSEIDPRPRTTSNPPSKEDVDDRFDHTSRAVTGWSSNIADRFKSPLDVELATDVPNWTARVEERCKAAFRPHDGIAAPQLKDWIAGAGFWDVKQVIVQLVVGGDTTRGQLMLEFLLSQLSVENGITKLATELPEVEIDALKSGKYFLNLHIVTGRKPIQPRPGDLLLDGTRQGMSDPIDDLSHYPIAKTTHWERYAKFDISGSLATNTPGRFKLFGPNLNDRISSLRMHGLSIGGHDYDDGSMMGASSMSTTSGPVGRGVSNTGAGSYQAAGRGSGPTDGPPIPWATRPFLPPYSSGGYYGRGISQPRPVVPQPALPPIPYTEVGSFKAVVPIAPSRRDASTNTDSAITGMGGTTIQAGTTEVSAAQANIDIVNTEPINTQTGITEGTSTEATDIDTVNPEPSGPAAVNTEVTGAHVTVIETAIAEIANTEVVSTEVVSTVVANTEVVSTKVVSTEGVNIETTNTEIVAAEVVPTEVVSTEAVSTEVVSTEVVSTEVVSTEAVSTEVVSTEVVSTGVVSTEVVSTEVVSTAIPTGATASDTVSTEIVSTLPVSPEATTTLTSTGVARLETPPTEATTAGDIKDGAVTITTSTVEAEVEVETETKTDDALTSGSTTGEAVTSKAVTEEHVTE